jgi:phosphoribosylaminoimidazole-succinocarboxamide synthase
MALFGHNVFEPDCTIYEVPMELGKQLAEGKTKIIYAHPTDPNLAIIQHKDGITAGDGARRNTIAGKGALSGRTTANVFALLRRNEIVSHYVDSPDATHMVVQRCQMIPLEVVMRRMAAGSYLKRHPGVAEGTRFDPVLVEFFLKDDARHDPQVSLDEIVELAVATAQEVAQMQAIGQRVFAILEQAWAGLDVALVDLKIEFGRPLASNEPGLIVADVIDNDSWRIWPGGEKARMLDKQVYRNMPHVSDEGLQQIRQLYETVAELTGKWA